MSKNNQILILASSILCLSISVASACYGLLGDEIHSGCPAGLTPEEEAELNEISGPNGGCGYTIFEPEIKICALQEESPTCKVCTLTLNRYEDRIERTYKNGYCSGGVCNASDYDPEEDKEPLSQPRIPRTDPVTGCASPCE